MLKFDFKGYSKAKECDVKIGEGDEDWPEVLKALAEIGYDGWATAEVERRRREVPARRLRADGQGARAKMTPARRDLGHHVNAHLS